MKITCTPAFVHHFGGQATLLAAALVCTLAITTTIAHAADPSTSLGAGPLPSWNEGAAKQSIVEFVTKVTTAGSPDFAPVPERIATPSTRHLTLETSQVAAVRRERARHA